MSDLRAFILQNLRLEAAPAIPEIQLYRAHAGSRLSRLGETSPYWAYHWAGGTVLARYILNHPETVRGRRAADLGAGSGIVAIAAAKAGAARVTAVDIDPYALAVIPLNAAANRVTVETQAGPVLTPPDADLILVGDLFYDAELAEKTTALLTLCVEAGIEVWVGDMGRKYLPLDRLVPLAEYDVPDFGQTETLQARVFKFKGP